MVIVLERGKILKKPVSKSNFSESPCELLIKLNLKKEEQQKRAINKSFVKVQKFITRFQQCFHSLKSQIQIYSYHKMCSI